MTELIDTQPRKSFRILLIGDSCIDEYEYGTVDRISPEAPVPVFKHKRHEERLGMVLNVERNLEALGCNVVLHTKPPSRKIRLVDEKTNQHIARIDHDQVSDPITFDDFDDYLNQYDAVVISDYDKGAVTYELMADIISAYYGPVFIDTKKTDLQRLEGAYVKINELEYSKATSTCSDMIVTLGANGVRFRGVVFPSLKSEVYDVCGAGDTFLAALVYYTLKEDVVKAIVKANNLAGFSVKHHGVYVPTEADINAVERIS